MRFGVFKTLGLICRKDKLTAAIRRIILPPQIVLHLQLIAGCLGVLIGADTAVGADAELLLGFLGHQIPLGGNDLNLLLGTVGVCGTDSVLLSLSVFIAASTGAKWCFLYYFYGRSPPPAA